MEKWRTLESKLPFFNSRITKLKMWMIVVLVVVL